MTLILFLVGIGLLIAGAELLVRGSVRLALGLGISPLVVGLTVVAAGTSSPELAVTVQSSLAGQADLALGNVVGSNIANVLLILGLAAVITPLVVQQKLVRLDVPIMIGVSLLLLLLALDGLISRVDGAILVTGIVAYVLLAVVQSRRENKRVAQEYAEEYDQTTRPTGWRWLQNIGLVVVGLALLVLGARWIVDGAVEFAHYMGVRELIVGLTVVAIGTSLPEIAATVIASLRGERDIAVGNVVGSCIFNILGVLGVAGVLAPAGVAVSPVLLQLDLPVMIAVMFACAPVFWYGYAIYRWEGALFLGYYLLYTVYLVLSASRSPSLPLFLFVIGVFVLPLTLVTLGVVWVRALRKPVKFG